MSAHVSERISAYIDRELAPAERAVVDAHLRDCPDCTRAVEEMRAVDALARGHEVPAPAGYFDALPARLRARLSPSPRARVPQWALALAAGLAVAVLAPLALRQAAGPEPGAKRAASQRDLPTEALRQGPRPEPAPTVAPAAPTAGAPLAPPVANERPVARQRAAAPSAEENVSVPRSAREPGRADAPSAAFALEPRQAAPVAGASTRAPAPVEAEAAGRAAQGAAAPRPATPQPDEESAEADEEEDATPLVSDDSAPPRKATDARAGALAPRAEAAPSRPGTEARLRSLSSRTTRSAAEARALRDAWQSFVREDPEGAHADDARLRALEAGAAAWRLGGLAEDRAQVERDARDYLRRPDGAHKERVRALLAGLEP